MSTTSTEIRSTAKWIQIGNSYHLIERIRSVHLIDRDGPCRLQFFFDDGSLQNVECSDKQSAREFMKNKFDITIEIDQ